MYDAILVLGGGFDTRDDTDKTLSPTSLARVEAATKDYFDGKAAWVLFCGGWSFRRKAPPPQTEAALMQAYASELGVSADVVLLEEKSKDTIGNAYYSKRDFVLPRGWRKLLIVTSLQHMARAEYVFRKVYGAKFSLHFSGVHAAGMRHNSEEDIMPLVQKYLDPITDGDDQAIGKFMFTIHPGYEQNKTTALTRLL